MGTNEEPVFPDSSEYENDLLLHNLLKECAKDWDAARKSKRPIDAINREELLSMVHPRIAWVFKTTTRAPVTRGAGAYAVWTNRLPSRPWKDLQDLKNKVVDNYYHFRSNEALFSWSYQGDEKEGRLKKNLKYFHQWNQAAMDRYLPCIPPAKLEGFKGTMWCD